MHPFKRQEAPHPTILGLTAEEFRRGVEYHTWRSRGTKDWLLILTVGGAGRIRSGEVETIASAGTVTLYQPDTPEEYFTDPETGVWHLLWSHFHPRPHWGAWLNWPEDTKGLRSITLRDAAVLRNVRGAMADTIRLSRQHLPGSMDLAINALERALLWIHSVNDRTALDERIRRAVDFIAENMREPLSLTRIAKESGLSISRLAHLFREQIGVPPQQYLEEVRLQRAAQLLRSTGLRIGEIAEETGFAGAFYFSNRFRKMFHQSPSEYRKQK